MAKTNAAQLEGKPKYKMLSQSITCIQNGEEHILRLSYKKSPELANIPYGL